MNAEHELLASAYLDGELSDDERRLAEADPAVMAAVAEFRALRERLADATPPSATAREAAIAAAMAEFHQLDVAAASSGAGAAARTEAPRERIVPFRPRPAYTRWLGVAAAVLVVGVLGVVIASGWRGTGSDDDAVDVAADVAADEPADEPADDGGADRLIESELAGADADTAESAGDLAASEPASAPTIQAAEEPAAEMADAPAEAAAEAPADEAADDEAIDPSRFFSLAGQPSEGRPIVPIESSDQLTWAADYLLGLAELGVLPATPETACPYPVFADSAVFVDGEAVPVHIAVLPDDDLVLALDTETCEIILDAPLER